MNRRRLHEVMNDPKLRRELFIRVIIATQAREGIKTTWEQAAKVYDAGKLKGGSVDVTI